MIGAADRPAPNGLLEATRIAGRSFTLGRGTPVEIVDAAESIGPWDVLDKESWTEREADHQQQVDELTSAHRSRVGAGHRHPVEDFLFTYYSFRPSQLRRWHPGGGVGLAGAGRAPHSGWRFYAVDGDVVRVSVDEFTAARGATLRFVRELLVRTAG